VLFFCFEFPPIIGGVGQFSYNIAKWLLECGINLTVLTPYRGAATSFEESIIRFPFPKNRFLRIAFSTVEIFKVYMLNRYDLTIITDMRALNIYGFLFRILPSQYIPVFHGAEVLVHLRKGKARSVKRWMLRQLIHHSKMCVSVSDYVKQAIVDEIAVDEEKISVIHNGIDAEEFRCKNRETIDEIRGELNLRGKKVIITMSRLIKEKNHELMIKMMAKYRNSMKGISYLIVGDGPEKAYLQNLAKQHGVSDDIIFFGEIDSRDPRKSCLYELAHVYVMPSSRETFGISFLESGVSGLPSIGSRVGGIPEIIIEGKTGFLISFSVSELHARLKSILENDELLREMGHKARKRILENFDKRPITEKWIQMLKKTENSTEINRIQRPTIFHIITNVGIGGAERALLRSMKHYNRKEFNHVVITMLGSGRLRKKFEEEGIEIISLNLKKAVPIFGILRLMRIIRVKKPRIIVAYLFHALSLAVLSKFILRDFHVVHYKRNFTMGSPLRDFVNRIFVFFIEYIIGVSNGTLENESRIKFRRGINEFLVYNGIEMPRVGKGVVKSNKIIIGTVARLVPQKGIVFLLRAIKELSLSKERVKLNIVGDGPQLKELQDYVQKNDLHEVVDFRGEVENVESHFRAFDIFILPSLYEGFSNVVLEAMSYGIPVIGTNVCGTNEIIKNGVNGILVEPETSREISKAIGKLIDNPSLRKRLGDGGRRTVENNYSIEMTVKKLERIYRMIINT
jgi:glycosyltransferase involved in cell wall biosynthesis